jgi:hypothetical protein
VDVSRLVRTLSRVVLTLAFVGASLAQSSPRRSFVLATRTAFGFTTGSSIVSAEDGRHVRVAGSRPVSRRLSPKWSALMADMRGPLLRADQRLRSISERRRVAGVVDGRDEPQGRRTDLADAGGAVKEQRA